MCRARRDENFLTQQLKMATCGWKETLQCLQYLQGRRRYLSGTEGVRRLGNTSRATGIL